MTDLKTRYMGIELKNPVIVGSNNLVTDPENAKKLEAAGAAALVYKSLFEEQIQLESYELETQMEEYNERNAEMTKLFPDVEHAGPREHILNLKKVVNAVEIPVFASLNCVNQETWVNWAKELEGTGIAGLELNFYHVPRDISVQEEVIVAEQIAVAESVVKAIKIPVAVKISPFYTNPLNFAHRLDHVGVKSIVMFNSLFQPDIDVNEQKLVYKYKFSTTEEHRLPLRYAGLLYKQIEADICSSRGVLSGEDVVKMILAGANVVQVVSAIYTNGIDQVTKMLEEVAVYLKKQNVGSVNEIRGKLSKINIKSPFAYRRAQYIDILMRSDNVLEEHVLR